MALLDNNFSGIAVGATDNVDAWTQRFSTMTDEDAVQIVVAVGHCGCRGLGVGEDGADVIHENSFVGVCRLVEGAERIGLSDGGAVHEIELATAVGESTYGLIAGMGLVDDAVGKVLQFGVGVEEVRIVLDKLLGGGDEDQMPVVVAEFEGYMQLGNRFEVVGPHDEMTVSRNKGVKRRGRGNLVLLRIVGVVADIEACHIEVCVGGVVEFQPVVLLECIVYEDAVDGTDLVDLYRRSQVGQQQSVVQSVVDGNQCMGAITERGQVKFRFCGDRLTVCLFA